MSAQQRRDQKLPFAEIVSLHQEVVYRYLLRFTRNVPDAQDLFQETFLRAHRAYAVLPEDVEWMRILNLSIGSASVDLLLARHASGVGVTVLRCEGELEILSVK